MARTMKKFSAGGAQGRYDRRMADIEKDRKIALAKGKNADVVEAKAAQRKADAEDDRAKRMGLDRTATRKAEYDAEQRLSRTRKFGADKPAAAAEPAKIAAPAAAPAAELAKAKPKSRREEFNEAFRAARKNPEAMKRGVFTFRGEKFTTKMASEGPKRTGTGTGASNSSTNNSAATVKQDANKTKQTTSSSTPALISSNASSDAVALLQASRVAREKKEAEERKKRIGMPAHERMAKGGAVKKEKTMKYRSGGSTPPKPTAADRAAGAKFRKSVKDLKVTPENAAAIGRGNRSTGMAKGGKAKAMPFAATKFGKALVKKSADTKGRAMVKKAGGGKCYASGGLVAGHKSADGIAKKGKTKGKMATMKKGGSC